MSKIRNALLFIRLESEDQHRVEWRLMLLQPERQPDERPRACGQRCVLLEPLGDRDHPYDAPNQGDEAIEAQAGWPARAWKHHGEGGRFFFQMGVVY